MSESVLVYRDVEISTKEFATVSPGSCLGDMIMAFQLRILEERFAASTNSLLLLPCTIQFFQRFPFDQIVETLDEFELSKYRYVFLPLSDIDVRQTDASHWSLLYVDRSSGLEFKHFDSLHHKNVGSGQTLANILGRYWNLEQVHVSLLECPTQDNNYDCGMYVVTYVEKFLETGGDHAAACRFLTPDFVTQRRNDVRDHIIAMANGQ
jgi:Ulp1 family protease